MKRRYCVAQNLLPFCYRIEKRYRWKWLAELHASRSQYLDVYETSWVLKENERLDDHDEFKRELMKYIAKK